MTMDGEGPFRIIPSRNGQSGGEDIKNTIQTMVNVMVNDGKCMFLRNSWRCE